MAPLVVGVVGPGYVGLPLAVEFGRVLETVGFDLSNPKVESYKNFRDPTGEVSEAQLKAASRLEFTTDASALSRADVIVVAVPTPVDEAHIPDFGPMLSACRGIGPNLKAGVTVVFESTVYPGATEEVCVPELERTSGKKWKKDFFIGYSPEAHQSGRQAAHAHDDREGGRGRHAGDARQGGAALRACGESGLASRKQHQGGRGRQGDREHATRPEHLAHKRARHHLPQDGHPVEFPQVQAGARRRPLHRRGSLLPHPWANSSPSRR